MTDKEKIRAKVERLFNHVKDSNSKEDEGAFYYLKDLLDFIDSLQEEPKPKSHKGKGVECAECADYWKKKGIEIGKKSREEKTRI